jgi:hypothetical protein
MTRLLVAGIACLALALAAALLARDVWHAEKALRDGDARAEATAVDHDVWTAAETMPFDITAEILGIEDDLAYRELITRAVKLARKPARSPEEARARTPTQAALRSLVQDDRHPRRAAQASHLLGLLVYSDPEDPVERVETPAQKAIGHFETAVLLDPGNDDAKRNLELMLQQERSESPRGQSARAGGEQPGRGGAGLAPPGHGY